MPVLMGKIEDGRPTRISSALLDLIRTKSVVPLRGTHVIELAKSGRPLQSREFLPKASLWTAEQLEAMHAQLTTHFGEAEAELRFAALFVAVSWRWHSPDHPDPAGKQIGVLAAATKAYLATGITTNARQRGFGSADQDVCAVHTLSWRGCTLRQRIFEPLGLYTTTDCAFLIDYVSLDASNGPARTALSGEARQALSLWLAHPGIALWMLVEPPDGIDVGENGTSDWWDWPFLERSVAELSKPAHMMLALSSNGVTAFAPPTVMCEAAVTVPVSFYLENATCVEGLERHAMEFCYGTLAAACLAQRGPVVTPTALDKLMCSAGSTKVNI